MSLLRRTAKVEEAPLQGELLLFDPASSRFFLLNQTMAFVWRNGEGKGADALVAEMVGAFEGAAEDLVREDVKKAVAELESLGLMHLDTA
jgi:hypothetical protein